jgi:hypothetical protein
MQCCQTSLCDNFGASFEGAVENSGNGAINSSHRGLLRSVQYVTVIELPPQTQLQV